MSLLKVLDVIAPPYTSDFVQLFLPILENDSIAGTIRTEGDHDPVAEFIGKRRTYLFMSVQCHTGERFQVFSIVIKSDQYMHEQN